MAFPRSVKQLCTPAYIYFLLSVIGIIMAIIQNVGNNRIYSLGAMSIPVPNTILVFTVKIVAILFWTWILNMMCNDEPLKDSQQRRYWKGLQYHALQTQLLTQNLIKLNQKVQATKIVHLLPGKHN